MLDAGVTPEVVKLSHLIRLDVSCSGVVVFFPGAYRGAELALLPQERRALRHFDQGIMRRLHCITGGGVCSGGNNYI